MLASFQNMTHDADYRRTSIIQHQIEIEYVKLSKEKLRRVPFHLQEDNDKAIEYMLAKNVIQTMRCRRCTC